MDSAVVRVRFAPSPTGHLHLGNVRTALFNWLFARSQGGTFILRLEDTDAVRSTQESVDSVLDDLRWLGLDWDEGPEAGGPFGPYRQTERYGLYAEVLRRLVEEGRAYPCFCTQEELDRGREEARKAGRTFVYPGTCRRLSGDEIRARLQDGGRPAYRLRIQPHTVAFTDLVRGPVSIHTQQFGDWILTRPDGSPTYNFAVVVDDALMKVTHVIRGEDHLSNTPKQIVLYEALNLPVPAFAHLSMILGPDGGKLSKRHGDVSLDAFRAKGFLPEGMVNGLALLGWSDPQEREILARDEITARFSLDRINKSAATFDEAKLRHVNREHLKRLTAAQVAEGIRPFLAAAGRLPEGAPAPALASWLERLAELLKDRIEVFGDAVAASDPVFLFDAGALPQAARGEMATPEARRVAEAFLDKAGSVDLSAPGAYREVTGALKRDLGVKGRALFHPLRLALTAAESGPDLERLVPILELGSKLDLPSPVLSPARRVRAVLAEAR
jgi:nondiscriminating glutamyl-tRNA synthetase